MNDSPSTDAAPAKSISKTCIAVELESRLSLPLSEYRGVETIERFSDTSSELTAFLRGAAIFDLGWKSILRCVGKDRVRWLNGMVTNSVAELKENTGCYAFVLNPQGRIQGDLDVYRHSDSLWLQTEVTQTETLRAFFEHYIIMDDVTLEPTPAWTAIGVAGPHAAAKLTAIGLPADSLTPMQSVQITWRNVDLHLVAAHSPLVPHYEIRLPVQAPLDLWNALVAVGVVPCGSAAIEQLRILEGSLAYGIDISNRDLPQETNQMRALHFSKGCYLGQEIVERIRSRGSVHRTFTGFELASEVPAKTPLQAEGQPAGELTSIARVTVPVAGERIVALGRVRLEPLEKKSSFMAGEVPATPSALPFDFARAAVQP